MSDQKPSMSPEMQKFLVATAEACGSPDLIQNALKVLLYGLMHSPAELAGLVRNLVAAGKIPDADVAAKALAPYLTVTAAPVQTAPATTDATVTPTVVQTAPKVQTTPKVQTAPKASDAGDLSEVKPVAVVLGEVETPVKNWREIFINLTEAALNAGKASDLPATWFRAGPAASRPTEVQLKDGKWLYMNLPKADQVNRSRTIAGLLGSSATVKTADGALVALA